MAGRVDRFLDEAKIDGEDVVDRQRVTNDNLKSWWRVAKFREGEEEDE